MNTAYNVTGTIENDQLIRLDKPLSISGKRVSVTIRPVKRGKPNGESLFAWLDQIHQHRKDRGAARMSRQEIDDWIKNERDGWRD